MPSTSRRPDRRPSATIIRDGVWEHRVGILTWILGGGVFNVFETYALHIEMADFVGGPKALAASVLPALEAMRPLRWPADGLDTLGGYMTYHNILMFQGFLALYAAVQGVHLVRRPEEQHSLEQILASGWSRLTYLRDRAIAFVITLALIALGLGASVAFAFAWVGEPDTAASFISLGAVGMCALVGFGLGLLAGQLGRSSRSAIGLAVIPLVVIYILTNEWENLGALGIVRFISPFHWANGSRALVPGIGYDLVGLAILAAMSGVAIALASIAFTKRDYGSGLWPRVAKAEPPHRVMRVNRWWFASIWRAQLRRHRVVIIAWALTTAAFSVLWMGLEPTVAQSWAMSDFFTQFLGAQAGLPVADMYISFGCDTMAPIVLAFAVSNATGWVADVHEGRVEAMLSAPLSWRRLMVERLVAATIAAGMVSVAWLTAGAIMGIVVDAPASGAGYGRAFALCLLLGWAGAALAALLAVLTRNTWATTGLIVYIVVAYVLGWFVDVLHWPTWLRRLSVFEAYAHPYREWPDTSNLAILIGVGLVASVAAAWIAERTPKVAG